jgi:hypothetical protein
MPSDQRTSIHPPELLRVHAFRGVHPFPHPSLNPSCMSSCPPIQGHFRQKRNCNGSIPTAVSRSPDAQPVSCAARTQEREEAISRNLPVSRLQYSFTSLEREKGRGSIWAEGTVARPLLISPTRSCAF